MAPCGARGAASTAEVTRPRRTRFLGAATDKPEDEDDDGDDEDQMDQPARHLEREKAEQPEHEKDYEDGPDHSPPFLFPGWRF